MRTGKLLIVAALFSLLIGICTVSAGAVCERELRAFGSEEMLSIAESVSPNYRYLLEAISKGNIDDNSTLKFSFCGKEVTCVSTDTSMVETLDRHNHPIPNSTEPCGYTFYGCLSDGSQVHVNLDWEYVATATFWNHTFVIGPLGNMYVESR